MSATPPGGVGHATGPAPWPPVDACYVSSLAATTSEKGRTALRSIRDAVGELRRNGRKINVESVGGLCKELHGGPLPQSIRNSDRSMAIVRAAAGAQAAETVAPTPGKPREVQVLESIPDPTLRAVAEGWFAERRAYWDEVCKLRGAARLDQAIAFVSNEMLEASVETLEEIVQLVRSTRAGSVGSSFDDGERAACRHFLEVGMAAAGMRADEPSGEIVSHVGRTVARAGVLGALRKIAAADVPDVSQSLRSR